MSDPLLGNLVPTVKRRKPSAPRKKYVELFADEFCIAHGYVLRGESIRDRCPEGVEMGAPCRLVALFYDANERGRVVYPEEGGAR